MKLSKTEEELLEHIWKLKKVFLKDLIDSLPEPRPATTTISTLLKRMQDKGFVGYNLFGNSREYFALVNKNDYFSKQVGSIVKNYFENSSLQFASFFTTTSHFTTSELEDLKKIIDKEIKRKQK